MPVKKFVLQFDEVSSKDGGRVGGKNAALGEMIRALKKQGVRVPQGFATTADAFRLFVRENKIDKKIRAEAGLEIIGLCRQDAAHAFFEK